MANQTLTGCINFDTGLAEFDQDDCEYFGCLVTRGLHAGQVAVTIGTPTCDDIFFGCVVFPEGTFEVVVPDDCCSEFGEACVECIDLAPLCINLTVSDIVECCVEGLAFEKFTLSSSSYSLNLVQSFGDPCLWADGIITFPDGTPIAVHEPFLDEDCETEPGFPTNWWEMLSSLTITEETVRVFVGIRQLGFDPVVPVFQASETGLSDPCTWLLESQTFNTNELECEGSNFFSGGQVTISPATCDD